VQLNGIEISRRENRKLAVVKVPFYVRTHLIESRVAFFMGLYAAKAAVDLPVIDQSDNLVDGRHRFAALERLEVVEAEFGIAKEQDRTKLIVLACQANLGGSLPPTQQDLVHTAELLFKQKQTRRQIIDQLIGISGFPREFAIRVVDDAKSNIAEARLNQAVHAVVDEGLTVVEAAARYEVDGRTLRGKLSGKPVKKIGAGEFNAAFSTKFRSHSASVARQMRTLKNGVDDGTISETSAKAIICHVKRLVRRTEKSFKEWERRFEASFDANRKLAKPGKKP